MKGRKLGRNASHRKAMFRNMACSLIRSVRVDEDDTERPKVAGRIVTTEPKAKELRPIVEKLITLARKAAVHAKRAEQYASTAQRNSDEWRTWRNSEKWNQWNQAIAPAVAMRRRAFAQLRDNQAVDVLFDELAERYADRPGGYTRVVRLARVRLGDAGKQALIEFVGERDRVKTKTRQAPAVVEDEPAAEESAPSASDEPEGDENSGDEATADATADAAPEDADAQASDAGAEGGDAETEGTEKEKSE